MNCFIFYRSARVLALVAGIVSTLPAHAVLISAYDHSYLSGGVEINLNVYDNQPGNRYLWEYTVNNNSYDPTPGVSNGFSGFELYLPSPIPEIADVKAPGEIPPWEVDCCSGRPIEWDLKNEDGNGLLPGQSGIFSFTTDPRSVAINNDGWFHSWELNAQTTVNTTLGMHVPLVPGLEPVDPDSVSVPEPGTLALFMIATIATISLSRIRSSSGSI